MLGLCCFLCCYYCCCYYSHTGAKLPRDGSSLKLIIKTWLRYCYFTYQVCEILIPLSYFSVCKSFFLNNKHWCSLASPSWAPSPESNELIQVSVCRVGGHSSHRLVSPELLFATWLPDSSVSVTSGLSYRFLRARCSSLSNALILWTRSCLSHTASPEPPLPWPAQPPYRREPPLPRPMQPLCRVSHFHKGKHSMWPALSRWHPGRVVSSFPSPSMPKCFVLSVLAHPCLWFLYVVFHYWTFALSFLLPLPPSSLEYLKWRLLEDDRW